MTTINPQVTALLDEQSVVNAYSVPEGADPVTLLSGIPETGSLEQLAGVPNAAELAVLANSLFPELTESVYDTQGYQPERQSGTQAANTGYVFGRTADFDWEHPFAYGGASTDNWLNTVEAVSDPAAGYLQDAANPAAVVEPQAISYSPAVMSKEQAAQNNRAIDAPTSLGGDSVQKGGTSKPAVSTSRDDSIRIGSKTLAQIRADFPILSEEINGNRLVWLDNGATTQRPRAVIDRLSYYYEHENSNVHRGAHTLAARSTDAYENARDIVRDFIGAPSSEQIVFVRGTTEAINLVANAYVKPLLEPGDEIIVSILEHHANIVPWQLVAQETGAVIKVIPCDETGQLKLHEYEKLFTKRTKFVSVTHVSNVLGTVTPVEELIAIAHRHGVRILIDGAQSVAHIPVNVSALDADFFVFSGHKIFAPTGIGVVYGKKELLEAARPYHGGGNMIADVTFERTIYNPAPNKFEAGTGSIADAVGLGAALQYLSEIGMPCVNRWEHELLQYAMKEMRRVKGLHLIGTALNKASVLSFKLDGYSDEEVGKRLDSYGIAVRTGHHCAQPVLRHFGYEGSVRPTLALYNSPDDIDAMVKVLKTFA
ncbi:MAG: cysteine desulfurase [Lachnospiraceae bacterium]|nr:cysteine desulfurase [Lachnospiraceae bacterium]